jgi:hypothetical protein
MPSGGYDLHFQRMKEERMTRRSFAGTMTKFCFKLDGVVSVFSESSA